MLINLHPEPADMARLVIEGMERRPRQLPAWLLYDREGSRLFEAICRQPEYSLTRTETDLLEHRAGQIAAALNSISSPKTAGNTAVIVEFGSGTARKVAPLLDAVHPRGYVALDISATDLADACRTLQESLPELPILGICCDYSGLKELPTHPLLSGSHRLGFYPGSSLGNFEPGAARELLEQFAQLLGPDGQLLVGIDQPKAVERLEAAYNDRAGCSAAFALNLLQRLNRDLNGTFDPGDFHYEAWWECERSRIAMALVSRREHEVRLAGRLWPFRRGELLITEYSYKYSPQMFVDLARSAGWTARARWSDARGDLSLHLLGQADSGNGRN